MAVNGISLDQALENTRTGDLWIFRGHSVADRAIQLTTNSPVNHVGMGLAPDDLPPLMWHAELGRGLTDLWTGTHQRGVQLHDAREAVLQWVHRYGQRAWLRQLDRPVSVEMEDAALRSVARLDGTPFPSTARLAGRWLGGRVPAWQQRRRLRTAGWDGDGRGPLRWRRGDPDAHPGGGSGAGAEGAGRNSPGADGTGADGSGADGSGGNGSVQAGRPALESAYCAEVVAITYQAMGLLPPGRRPNWYDPGRFWSGDDLELTGGYRLGPEIRVEVGPAPAERPVR